MAKFLDETGLNALWSKIKSLVNSESLFTSGEGEGSIVIKAEDAGTATGVKAVNLGHRFDMTDVTSAASVMSSLGEAGIATMSENGEEDMSASIASGAKSLAEGAGCHAKGIASHAEGILSFAGLGDMESEEGAPNGYGSHAEGGFNQAYGNFSHAEGQQNKAYGTSSHAEGCLTTASGEYSHAEGYESEASGDYSHAEGVSTLASGSNSHAEGSSTATGDYSHAEGNGTTAKGNFSHAEGTCNVGSSLSIHSVGIGESEQRCKSAEEIFFEGNNTKNGYKYLIGLGGFDGTNFESTDDSGNAIVNPDIKSVQEVINELASSSVERIPEDVINSLTAD